MNHMLKLILKGITHITVRHYLKTVIKGECFLYVTYVVVVQNFQSMGLLRVMLFSVQTIAKH